MPLPVCYAVGMNDAEMSQPPRGMHRLSMRHLIVALFLFVAIGGLLAFTDPTARNQMRSWYGSLIGTAVSQPHLEGSLYLTLHSGTYLNAHRLSLADDELVKEPLDGDRALEWTAVSPSGEEIAYLLRKTDTDPAEIRVLVLASGERTTVLSPAPESARHIRWSPDGETLIFTAREQSAENESDVEPDDWAVYSVSASGGEMQRVARGTSPFFSPDGSIVLSLQNNGLYATALADGTSKIVRTMQGGSANRFMDVSLSPDGTKLLWTNPLSENREGKLFIFDITSWSPITLSEVAHVVRMPALHAVFSPDSAFVAFSTSPKAESGTNPSVYLLDLASLSTRLIFDLAGYDLRQTALTDWR